MEDLSASKPEVVNVVGSLPFLQCHISDRPIWPAVFAYQHAESDEFNEVSFITNLLSYLLLSILLSHTLQAIRRLNFSLCKTLWC
jgi:hypothetical protein